ncbi:Brix domain-containing protein [Methanobrevibacter woesei]|jgi:U3 small nucleolar ribonucleoprotein protein IMP4|uniref:Brix domain-containing protein n=2 Tax=Methanobrevibacter woesei TaxID=190976 RepID=UPI0023579932|nr:ribonucleotide-diphosphate reductase subunit beta [Methanobrevibacter woesei]MCI7290725.1 ribonucleotide-diphosphate reductase subunit beta [Methanobrevibacter woesei]
MLISTSRKPSQKTRKFCKNFSHATVSSYVNRGKMNMRELLLKALELGEVNIAVVHEIKGNPSRITFYSNKGEVLLVLLINVTLTNERLHISPKNLTVVSEVEKLNSLAEIFTFPLVEEDNANYIKINKTDDDLVAKINFINKFEEEIPFQINVRKVLKE